MTSQQQLDSRQRLRKKPLSQRGLNTIATFEYVLFLILPPFRKKQIPVDRDLLINGKSKALTLQNMFKLFKHYFWHFI